MSFTRLHSTGLIESFLKQQWQKRTCFIFLNVNIFCLLFLNTLPEYFWESDHWSSKVKHLRTSQSAMEICGRQYVAQLTEPTTYSSSRQQLAVTLW